MMRRSTPKLRQVESKESGQVEEYYGKYRLSDINMATIKVEEDHEELKK